MKKDIEKIYKIFLKKKSIKIDSRKIKKGDIFFTISGNNFNANSFSESALKNGAALVILDDEKIYKKLSKKYSEKIFFVENSLKTLQNLAKKYRSDLKIPFLAITGSNGKTTTKELIKKVLSQKFNILATEGNLNNHIGVPLTILSINDKHNFVIIEMGANHIGEIKELAKITKPDFGIITNIGLAHIGEFGSLQNIIKTKKELYNEILKNNGKIFINSENKILQKISKQFSVTKKISYYQGKILKNKKFLKIKVNKKEIKTKVFGEYNLENFLAAFSIGKFFKISEKKIISALENYKPKNNRSEIKTTLNKNEIIWDSYNSNPTSLNLSISNFLNIKSKKEKILIIGDMKELGEYSKNEHEKILKIILKTKITSFFIGNDFLKLKKQNLKNKNFTFLKNIKDLEKNLKEKKYKNKLFLIKGSNSINLIYLKNKKFL